MVQGSRVKFYQIVFLRPTGTPTPAVDEMGAPMMFREKPEAARKLRDVREHAKDSVEAQRYKLAELYIQ
jgi:hypothetical protein